MRTLLVTAANEAFMPLLRGLVGSLQQWEPRPFTDLACFDLRFTPESRRWIERFATHVVTPGWDLPVDEELRRQQPELRALTVRPFLPRYFPGYDVYFGSTPMPGCRSGSPLTGISPPPCDSSLKLRSKGETRTVSLRFSSAD
jgi:hypothetical protein